MPHIIHVGFLAWIKLWTGNYLHNENVPGNDEEAVIIDVDVKVLIVFGSNGSGERVSQVSTAQKEHLENREY